ncbi:MAG TPA: DUF72 domain-containing protein [Spongiibacteraceae bacterium]|nr:DUF72 domain-containing protein [Spongiibacteraceae bacterium]
MAKTLNIGISGWRYAPWRGTFYPQGLAQRRELEFASRMLPSIEINGSFYNLQRPQSYASWYADTPTDFVFSVKAPRYITHILRLRDIATPLANFFASGLFNLREKLGPILWQFPPGFRFDPVLFESFLKALPRDTGQASAIARNHDSHIAGRAALHIDKSRPLRHAIEIRNRSFVAPQFIDLLRAYKVALVVADTAGKWPYYEDVTADFIYLRLHGDVELYASGYSDAALERWARRIEKWQSGAQPDDAVLIARSAAIPRIRRDVFCYFDNDVKVKAPFDAATLLAKLGVDSPLLTNESVLHANGPMRSVAGGKKVG